jgi:hypothetical protein
MPISSLEFCKKKKYMEKFQTFMCPFALCHTHKQQSTEKNMENLTNNENNTKSKQKNQQTFKINQNPFKKLFVFHELVVVFNHNIVRC